MAFTLESIDATNFNFVSDLLSVACRLGLGFCLAHLYGLLLSYHFRTGKTAPLKTLGAVPASFAEGAQMARFLQFSLPAVALLVLLLLADFSHSFADLGLSFVTVSQQGANDTVLSLTQRNPNFPFETVGDPYNLRTAIALEPFAYFEDAGDSSTLDQNLLSEDLRLVMSFVAAADAISRGESPFLLGGAFLEKDAVAQQGLEDFMGVFTFYQQAKAGSFLSAINLAIPLVCSSDSSSEMGGMRSIPQQQGTSEEEIIYTLASVPNCSFDNARPTGIFNGDNKNNNNNPQRAEITAYSRTQLSYDDASEVSVTPKGIAVIVGGEALTILGMPADARDLARDYNNWKGGRAVGGFDAIQYGSLQIPLGMSVFASGGEASPIFELDENLDIVARRTSEYILVSEILGECPEPPGEKSENAANDCLSFLTFRCATWPEDYLDLAKSDDITIDEASFCQILGVELLWGNNFAIDEAFIAAVAGVYGRNRKSVRGGMSENLALNAVHSALFILGSTDTAPANLEVVRPSINAVYIVFMVLPIFLGLGCLLFAYVRKDDRISIPQEPWHLLVLGSEEDVIPTRASCREKFPKAVAELQFGVVSKESTTDGEAQFGVQSPLPEQNDLELVEEQEEIESSLVEEAPEKSNTEDTDSMDDKGNNSGDIEEMSV